MKTGEEHPAPSLHSGAGEVGQTRGAEEPCVGAGEVGQTHRAEEPRVVAGAGAGVVAGPGVVSSVRRAKLMPLAAGAGFVVFWSCGFIGARWGTEYTSAFDLLAWRFLVAGALAAIVLLVRRPAITRRDLVTQVWMALLTQCVYLGLIFTGIDHGISAGVTALIGSLQPILIATVAGPLLGERVSQRQWIGLVVGVVGVGLVVADDLHGSPLLFLLPFGGLLGLVVGTCMDRRRKPSTNSLDALCVQSLVSAVFFVALAASTDQLTVPSQVGFYGAVLWLVLLATGGGWGLYLVNLKLSGATRISSLLYLVPPTTMVFAFLLFHETIGPLAVIGMLICAIAVLLIRLDERAEPVLATLRGWRNPGG